MCVCVCVSLSGCAFFVFFFFGGGGHLPFSCALLLGSRKSKASFSCVFFLLSFFFLCVNFIDFCCCCFELLSGHLLFRLAFVFCVFLLFTYVLHTVPLKGNERQRKLFFFFLVLVTDNLDAAPLKFGEYKRCWLPRRPCAGRPQALFRTLQNTRPSSFRENG